jgi:hypothetical protein
VQEQVGGSVRCALARRRGRKEPRARTRASHRRNQRTGPWSKGTPASNGGQPGGAIRLGREGNERGGRGGLNGAERGPLTLLKSRTRWRNSRIETAGRDCRRLKKLP